MLPYFQIRKALSTLATIVADL